MFKRISLGLGTMALLAGALSVGLSQPALARTCYPTFIPYGYYPTNTPCGTAGCSGVIYDSKFGNPMCVITEDEY